MIAFIEGDLIECQLNLAIIQVGGIGYEVHIPLTTSEKLPALGQEIKLFTQAVYREDAQTLYGFADRESRDFFRMIVDKVSGIGPKIALNLLGSLSLPTLKVEHQYRNGAPFRMLRDPLGSLVLDQRTQHRRRFADLDWPLRR